MNFFTKLITSIGLFTLLCLPLSQSDALLASVKTTGMAETGIANPLDTFSAAYNPAGMVDVRDRLDFEFYWQKMNGNATISGNTFPRLQEVNTTYHGFKHNNPIYAEFGINKMLNCHLSLGLIGYNRKYLKTHYQPLILLGTSDLQLEYINETISAVFAIRLEKGHSLGISLDYQIARLKVSGLENFDSPFRSINPGHVTNRGHDYSHGLGATFGWKWDASDNISVGLVYTPRTHMSRFKKYEGFLAKSGRIDIPEKIGAGLAWRLNPCLLLAFDMQHLNWKKIRSLHNSFLNDFGVMNYFGAPNGPGFGWKNQTFFSLGLNYQVLENLALRTGYRFATLPIKHDQSFLNLLLVDTIQHELAIGATWNITEHQELSFAYVHGFQNQIRGNDSIPVFLGGGNVNLKQSKDIIAITWGYTPCWNTLF